PDPIPPPSRPLHLCKKTWDPPLQSKHKCCGCVLLACVVYLLGFLTYIAVIISRRFYSMQTKIEKISPLSAFAINNYTEQDCLSCDFLSFREKLSCAVISHPEKSREWKGARMAIKEALDC